MSSATSFGCQTSSGEASDTGHRLEDLATLEVGLERLGNPDGSVRLLVGLEDRHDGARDGDQGAVEGGDRLDLTVETSADVESPGLEVGAVGGRGQLAITPLGRDPCLAVELALGGEPEVPGGHVDDAVGELELL